VVDSGESPQPRGISAENEDDDISLHRHLDDRHGSALLPLGSVAGGGRLMLTPIVPLFFSFFGVLHVFLYMTLIGENCHILGDSKWLLWRCKSQKKVKMFKFNFRREVPCLQAGDESR